MKSTNKAFTLVELIVVISILAILGTIAFISLQGYSSEARNTKRLSDLKSIQSSITTNVAKNGTALSSFVIADATATISSIALGGATAATQDAADYSAGTPNFAALDMNQSEFQDPTDDSDYAIGFTTLGAKGYQVAASMETDGGEEAKVSGTFSARSDAAKDLTAASVSGDTVVNVTSTGVNFFKVGDTTNLGIVSKVSADGSKVTLSTGTTVVASTMNLVTAETASLIGSASDGTAVSNGGSVLPY